MAWEIYLFFFFIALVYSSVGFGGGSLYTAVLSQTISAVPQLRLISLTCNTVVTGNNLLQYQKSKLIDWKSTWTILAFSIPFCLWSSSFKIDSQTLKVLLAIFLVLSAVAIILQSRLQKPMEDAHNDHWLIYPLSAVIGFISGLTGIGGGIYFTPLLYLMRWRNEKKIAAFASAFIAINSIFGIIGQWVFHQQWPSFSWILLPFVALAGGWVGSKMGIKIFNFTAVRFTTVGLLLVAAFRLLWKI
ncbi:MAG: sulfite exporter TauE/SafE family protein [Flavobacteriales bacterium]